MDLNEDQRTLQEWVHGFAQNVMRPAAHEWDEREETPWPIIEEAAAIGIYGLDFMANALADPTGLSLVLPAIMSNGTPQQQMEWIPQCYGTPEDIKLAAFGVSEPDAGSDVSSLR